MQYDLDSSEANRIRVALLAEANRLKQDARWARQEKKERSAELLDQEIIKHGELAKRLCKN